jgi:hypothetical protein
MLGTYLKCFVDLNAMVHAFLFNMITDIIVNVMMHVMCRKGLELLGRTIANGGQPQVEDKYKKVVVERLMKGLWEFPMKHH